MPDRRRPRRSRVSDGRGKGTRGSGGKSPDGSTRRRASALFKAPASLGEGEEPPPLGRTPRSARSSAGELGKKDKDTEKEKEKED